MDVFKTELKIMKRLRHKHIVRYVGSFTDTRDLGLLMSPVADCDLGAFLEEACKTPKLHPTLRTFFGCLATALSYLHEAGIKHRDIKPQNVLVHKANVLLADFGISRDFLDTTTGPTTATLRYCAPEVAAHEGRSSSADVWSLGCVFLEMQSALQAKDLKDYYERHGTRSTQYHANLPATFQILKELRRTAADAMHMQPLTWIERMLVVQRRDRCKATEIMNLITSSDSPTGFMYSCDQCCYSSSESDAFYDVEDEAVGTSQPACDSQNRQGLGVLAYGSDILALESEQNSERVSRLAFGRVERSDPPTETSNNDTIGVGALHFDFKSIEPQYLSDHSNGLSSAQADIATAVSESTPKYVNASLLEDKDPGADDLYADDLYADHLQDGFSESTFHFKVRRTTAELFTIQTLEGRIPNIVIHCTTVILNEAHARTRTIDLSCSAGMEPGRFEFWRNEFQFSWRNEPNVSEAARVGIHEAPILLKMYLHSLRTPLIPEDAQHEWMRFRTTENPIPMVCLAFFDLKRARRDLLLYLLLYMAQYGASVSKSRSFAAVAEAYGPYVCAAEYLHPRRELNLAVFLIENVHHIMEYISDAGGEAAAKKKLRRRIDPNIRGFPNIREISDYELFPRGYDPNRRQRGDHELLPWK